MWEDAQADYEAEMARDAEPEREDDFEEAPYYHRPEYYSPECSALGHDN